MNVISVRLTWAEVQHGALVGVSREVQNLERGRRHVAGADPALGWLNAITGALGELAVAKGLGRYWTGLGSLGDLDAFDVDGLEVRWSSGTDLILRERDADDRPYVLVTGAPPAYRIHGWIMGHAGKQDFFFGDKRQNGRPPAYFVPATALNDLDYVPDLRRAPVTP